MKTPVGGAGASIRQFDLFGPSLREKREQAAPKPAETRKATAAASPDDEQRKHAPTPAAGDRRGQQKDVRPLSAAELADRVRPIIGTAQPRTGGGADRVRPIIGTAQPRT